MNLVTLLMLAAAYFAGGVPSAAAIYFGSRLHEARADGRIKGGGHHD